MFIKSSILLVSAATLLALSACGFNDSVPAAGTTTTGGGVAATVNGSPISERFVDMMLKQRTDLGREASAEVRKAFVDRLAMQLVITQEAVKNGFDKKPEVMDRLELSRQSVLIDAFIKEYLKNHAVSEDELKAGYEKVKLEASGNEYKARHILVESEAEAKQIIARLKKNVKEFEALANVRSKDRGSKANGGDLGWFDPQGMVPEFGAAVAALSKGEFSEIPVKTQFGYHVILLEDTRAKSVPPLEQVKDTLMQQLQSQNLKKHLDELKAKAKIEIAAAPGPAAAAAVKPAESTKK